MERVTIVGLGNVALDCARVLLRRPQDLASTDIAEHALEALRRSSVRRVDLVGRRGAVQVRAHARVLCCGQRDVAGWHLQGSACYIACASYTKDQPHAARAAASQHCAAACSLHA